MKSSTWAYKTLGEVSLNIFDGPHATPTKISSGPWYLSISSLEDGRIDLTQSAHLSEADYLTWTRRVTPQENDLVFSYETRLGQAALVPPGLKCCLGRRMGLIRPDPKQIDARYLLYYYLSDEFQNLIRQKTIAGSTVERILIQEVPTFQVLVPPLPTQRAIARILGALDDKIDLNRRMNRTLEAMAQAVFKSWFVDFDPVTARAEGRKPFGMDAETVGLFPGKFVSTQDENFPEIPEGWQLESLSNIARYENGLALQKYRPDGNEYLPAIKIKELRQGFADASSEKARPSISAAYIIDDGDVVFSWSGSLLVDIWCGGKGALNQHLFKVTSRNYPKWFYYHWTKFHLPEFRAIASDKATTMGHIQRHHLESAKVVVPTAECMQAADKLIRPLTELIIRNRVQSRSLANLRDTLLPRLLSGELTVRAAEEAVEV